MEKNPKDADFRKDSFEMAAWVRKSTVIGVDEVGRGCLAGPLVTGAVALPLDTPENLLTEVLRDSKLLGKKQRECAFEWITTHCDYGVGIVHPRGVDTHNIWHATLIAMKKALTALFAVKKGAPPAESILIDAMPVTLADTAYHGMPVHHFPKGELKSSSIAAASIVAKVTRDRLMGRLALIFPRYKLGDHKGYATKKHRDAIAAHGLSLAHRVSFCTRICKQETSDRAEQQLLC